MSDPKNALKNKSSKSRELSSSDDSDSDYLTEKIFSSIVIPESDHEESCMDVSQDLFASYEEERENLGTNDTITGSASEIITYDDYNVSRTEVNIQSTGYSTPTVQKQRHSLLFMSALDGSLDESGNSEFWSFTVTSSQEVESQNLQEVVPLRASRRSLAEGNNAYLHSTAPSISSISLTQDEENDSPPNANEGNSSVNTVNDVIETIDSDSSDCVPVDGGHILAEKATLDTVEDVPKPLSSPGTNVVDVTIVNRYDVDKQLSLTPPPQSSYNASVQDPRQENRFIDLTQSDGSLQNSPIGAIMPRPVQKSTRTVEQIVAIITYVTEQMNSNEALLENVNPDQRKNLMIKITDFKNQIFRLEQELAVHSDYNHQKAALEGYKLKKKTGSLLKKQTDLKFEPVVKSEPREYMQEDLIDEIENSPKSAKGYPEMPDWGDLPQPDMTISNFGKRAMETLIAEQTLTSEALATLHKALKNCPERPDNQFTSTKELAALHRKLQGADIKTHQNLVLLLRLRQICCHPGLVKKMVESGDLDLDVRIEDESGVDVDLFSQMNKLNINDDIFDQKFIKEEIENHAHVLSIDNPVLSLDRASAKIRALLDTLEETVLKSDDKAIIVSQWTSFLNIVSKFLSQKGVRTDSLTGEVAVHKRQDLINAFNERSHGPQVLLLSLTAGGVGLNLAGANHLFLVDIHWNPQLENQACDRIYRVGQKKDVFVYRFITVNTIEERIKCLQEKKLALADSVLTGTMRTNAAKLTLDDLKMLFAVPKALALAPAPAPRVL